MGALLMKFTRKPYKKIIQALILILVMYACALTDIEKKFGPRNPASNTFNSESRSPASIQKVFDFSYLQGSALLSAAKDRLSSSIFIVTSDDKSHVTITLGNYVLKSDSSQRDFACGFYDRLTFLFEAEGMSVDGEKPTLSIESGCEVGSNINFLNPITVPIAKLKSEAPTNTEFKFFDSRTPTKIQLSANLQSWPTKWVLTEVKMTHSTFSTRVLDLKPSDWNSDGNHMITMNW
jgi:hypothetical protein